MKPKNSEAENKVALILGKRIQKLFKITNTNREDLRSYIGYSSRGTLSQVIKGERFMSQEALHKAAEFFGVHVSILTDSNELTDEQLETHIELMKVFRKKGDLSAIRAVIKSVLDK